MRATVELLEYLNRHFIDRAKFLTSANIDDRLFTGLIDARALPGPIYKVWSSGSLWSPMLDWVGPALDTAPDAEWYSPAATWWARRAKVLAETGVDASAIARTLFEAFRADFVDTIAALPVAKFGYDHLFTEGKISVERSLEMAAEEWDDWINGGYGVCLRRFDARSLVIKTSEAKRVQSITNCGRKDTLTAHEKLDLLDAMERLETVMLPFAPHERPCGTPGFWIDEPLAKYGMGSIPFVRSTMNAALAAPRLCA